MHLHPYSEIDLHFFLLAPETREFALLTDLEHESEIIVQSVLDNIHLNGAILLILLLSLKVCSNITHPIIALAKDTKKVAEGKLDEVEISQSKQKDEIAVLCASFQEMVNGLKEKEKMKGVLNKVVSEEVAREILKGSVHISALNQWNLEQKAQNLPIIEMGIGIHTGEVLVGNMGGGESDELLFL